MRTRRSPPPARHPGRVSSARMATHLHRGELLSSEAATVHLASVQLRRPSPPRCGGARVGHPRALQTGASPRRLLSHMHAFCSKRVFYALWHSGTLAKQRAHPTLSGRPAPCLHPGTCKRERTRNDAACAHIPQAHSLRVMSSNALAAAGEAEERPPVRAKPATTKTRVLGASTPASVTAVLVPLSVRSEMLEPRGGALSSLSLV